eukprot:PLAT6580.1.p1 GENE.PLAT6580.1~~PLAT6580.1.p1  ORF type:complete len:425 (-),score=112.10 PLAT6580.1:164-1342(-)
MEEEKDGEYAWEKSYERSWEMLKESEEGTLELSALAARRERARLAIISEPIRRGLIRYVFLIVDLSQTMARTDMKPSRLALALSSSKEMVRQFVDQNPLSQLGVITTRDGLARKLTDLSGNASRHIEALDSCRTVGGFPSLQNALEVACDSLATVPNYGSREVVCIISSLTTRDPGDLFVTLAKLVKLKVRVSFVSLAAEVFFCRKLATESSGQYDVALDRGHFTELLLRHVVPPPTPAGSAPPPVQFVRMGFPTHAVQRTPSLCSCHERMTKAGYRCPRCLAKYCDLPAECRCGLTLVSSPHLARSYHHLFPVAAFLRDGEDGQRDAAAGKHASAAMEDADDEDNRCCGCAAPLSSSAADPRLRCPSCGSCFCATCDELIHEALFVCPGCA